MPLGLLLLLSASAFADDALRARCDGALDPVDETGLQACVEAWIDHEPDSPWTDYYGFFLAVERGQARMAIDALSALVKALTGRIGEHEANLSQALQQVEMIYVQRSAEARPADDQS